MYTLDNEGRHIGPRAEGGEVCAELVDNLVNSEVPAVAPARGALIAILEMGPSERTQGWSPKQFDHGTQINLATITITITTAQTVHLINHTT